MRLKAEIEQAKKVNAESFKHLAVAQEQRDLDAAQAYLEQHFTGESWFVYRGGSHVALWWYTSSGSIMGPRVAIIREVAAEIEQIDAELQDQVVATVLGA